MTTRTVSFFAAALLTTLGGLSAAPRVAQAQVWIAPAPVLIVPVCRTVCAPVCSTVCGLYGCSPVCAPVCQPVCP